MTQTVTPVTLLKPVARLSDYDYVETCRCPRCGTSTHPEHLQSNGNDVYGCSDCVQRVQRVKPEPTPEAAPSAPVTLLQPVARLSDYAYAETCRCPRCGTFTHPEYLQSKGDDVYGCSSCVKRVGATA